MACKVFEGLLQEYMPEGMADRVSYLDYGLHRVPAKLTWAVQEAIDSIEEPSLIVLGYGLCGNGLDGIKAGKHTLLIARADDCIAILLGSYRRYIQEFEANPGTYYLTKGWLESGSDPLKEYRQAAERFGPEKAQRIMDLQYRHYKRLIFVAHAEADLAAYRDRALAVAAYCEEQWGMEYEERIGSEAYIMGLADAAIALSEGRPDDLSPDEFLVVPPGEELRQFDLLRLNLETSD